MTESNTVYAFCTSLMDGIEDNFNTFLPTKEILIEGNIEKLKLLREITNEAIEKVRKVRDHKIGNDPVLN
jgi:hypothetical protein